MNSPTQTLQQPEAEVRDNGMFGYAIGSVGDLNQDNLDGEFFFFLRDILTLPVLTNIWKAGYSEYS